VRQPSAVCLDLGLDLLVLPLSYIVLNIVLLLGLAGVASICARGMSAWLWIGTFCALGTAVYVLRGWQLSGIGARGLLDLCRAPGFLLWKLWLMLRRHRSSDWVRTERER